LAAPVFERGGGHLVGGGRAFGQNTTAAKTKNDFAALRLRTTSMFSIGQTNKQAGGQWPGGWNLPFDHFPI